MNDKEGIRALEIARQAIDIWVREHQKLMLHDYPKSFDRNCGVFVTIFTYPEKNLRGCIGYPEPIMPFILALVNSAINAAQDPRFEPLSMNELDNIVVEVSVLTKPRLFEVKKPEEYPKKINIGSDGLIVESGYNKGLLLPEVATEHNMDAKEFLSHTCLKAGLPPEAWKDSSTRIYRFRTQKFREKKPRRPG